MFKSQAGKVWVASTDVLVEDTHFKREWFDNWKLLGGKAVAVNLSDLAAMGAVEPAYALASIGLPPDFTTHNFQAIFAGLTQTAGSYGLEIIGGDTVKSKTIFVSVTVLGLAERSEILQRSTAKPGDAILVTGTLGEAAIGLDILLNGTKNRYKPLLQRFFSPKPRLAWATKLGESRIPTAMIDCSDGLLRSVEWLTKLSGTGAVIETSKIPVSARLKAWAKNHGKNPLTFGLCGGEDYELIFTAPLNRITYLKKLVPCTSVGAIISKEKGVNITYKGKEISSKAFKEVFEHFR